MTPALFWSIVAATISVSDVEMVSSRMDTEKVVMGQTGAPRLPDAAELTGGWRMEGEDGSACDLVLDARAVLFDGPHAPAHVLTAASPCLASMSLGGVKAWRPSSDGIALLRNDGSLVVFLSRRGQGFEGSGPDGERLRLVRA